MRNPLISSVITVTLIWFTIMYIFVHPSGVFFGLMALPLDIVRSTFYMAVGLAVGAIETAIVLFWMRGNVVGSLVGGELRGLKFSLGNSSMVSRDPLPKVKDDAEDLLAPDLFEFYEEYEKKYPKHAAFFLEVAQTLRFHKKTPASPIKGGHGGASLETHTLNVVRNAIKQQSTFVYEGHKNNKGRVVFARQDAEYVFNKPEDPMGVLCAIAHDIGKIECYIPLSGGNVLEAKPRHGEIGGKMLAGFPSFWELPQADREALILSVTFYHYVSGIPTWVSDRVRALTEFTIAVDIETGKQEGDTDRSASFVGMDDENASSMSDDEIKKMELALSKFDDSLAEHATAHNNSKNKGKKGKNHLFNGGEDIEVASDDIFGANPNRAKAGTDKPAKPTPPQASISEAPKATPVKLDSYDAQLAFTDFTKTVNAANSFGNAKADRIGFKQGEWLYIQDVPLREKVERISGRSVSDETPTTHPFTKALLNKLKELDALYFVHEGKTHPADNAIFDCEVTMKTGKTAIIPRCFLVKSALFHSLAEHKDAAFPLRILGQSFPDEIKQEPVEKEEVVVSDEASMFTKNADAIAPVSPIEATVELSQTETKAAEQPIEATETEAAEEAPVVVPLSEGVSITSLSNSAYASVVQPEEEIVPSSSLIKDELVAMVNNGTIESIGGWITEANNMTVALIPEAYIQERYELQFGDEIESARWRNVDKAGGKVKVLVVRVK